MSGIKKVARMIEQSIDEDSRRCASCAEKSPEIHTMFHQSVKVEAIARVKTERVIRSRTPHQSESGNSERIRQIRFNDKDQDLPWTA